VRLSKFAPLNAALEAKLDKVAKDANEIKAMDYTVDIVPEIPVFQIPEAALPKNNSRN
jgi:hypothetical protein